MMKRIWLYFFVVMLVVVSCTSVGSSEIVLIDVRTNDEWVEGHLEGAVHIPLDMLAGEIANVVDDKSRKVGVYCLSGGRAEQAKLLLESMGYTNVTNYGGYEEASHKLNRKIVNSR